MTPLAHPTTDREGSALLCHDGAELGYPPVLHTDVGISR
jgi:hypothetical protein